MTTQLTPRYAAPCPAMIDAPHDVEWMIVPASIHDADGTIHRTDSYERGFCWNCDEQFTRGI